MESSESPAAFQGDPLEALMHGLTQSQRAAMLDAYARALQEAGNPLTNDNTALEQALANADQILDDVARAIRTGRTDPDDKYRLLAWEIGASRAQANAHPEHSLAA